MRDDLVFGMAGSGGDGIVSAGESLIAAAAADGYHAIMTKSFGSQIRGGESSCRVRIATAEVLNPGGALDVAVALNWDDFTRFGAELPVSGSTVVLYDARTGIQPHEVPLVGVTPKEVLPIPIADLAREHAGSERAKNSVVLGLVAGFFEVSREGLLNGLRRRLAKKGEEVLRSAERAFAAGEAWAAAHPLREPMPLARPAASAPARMLTDGNEVCGAAAIAAGCRFFGGYPITPSTEIMQFLSREIWKYGGAVLQAEDEIAGIGAAVGASFAGVKAMTATSGPGMSLKSEIMGLATIAELPLVIVNVQRGGPSTGMPTKAEQADLYQAAFSAHGDAARPVLAPTSVTDTFWTTVQAFNVAERFQTPVIVLSDQEIAQRKETLDDIDVGAIEIEERRRPGEGELQDYARFTLTASGVSPISQPGVRGGAYLASGIEHNERGAPTASGALHSRMNEKRFHKLEPLKRRADLFRVFGDEAAPVGLVSWGSCAGVCREALAHARARGLKAKLLVPHLLYPVAEEVYGDFFASVRAGLVVEQSHQGQLYRMLRMFLDLPRGVRSLARSGANPFLPIEVAERLHAAAEALQRDGGSARQPQE
ncbi:MAG TPA: 2-oxoacid:acceptor oxidoreductase subunit alpha [Vicinamibacteria bacterium]|jgi:2-oxoglutarate ferredoxin oxidoreductase subunit alpha